MKVYRGILNHGIVQFSSFVSWQREAPFSWSGPGIRHWCSDTTIYLIPPQRTSCTWTLTRCGSRCNPHRTCEDRWATLGSCSFRGRSCRRETRRESPGPASSPTTMPSWTGAVGPLHSDSAFRQPPTTRIRWKNRTDNNYIVSREPIPLLRFELATVKLNDPDAAASIHRSFQAGRSKRECRKLSVSSLSPSQFDNIGLTSVLTRWASGGNIHTIYLLRCNTERTC